MIEDTLKLLLDNRIQVFSIIGSLMLFLFILRLVKRRKLKEEYSLLWLGFGFVFIVLSIFKPMLEIVASAVGILYAPAALLLMLVISVFFILIQFSIVISKLAEGNKNLIQEVGILKAELKKLKSLIKDKE
ncbi:MULTISPECIES: DUF2304 domain-containing protein [Cellvibrio]|jgi:hypothetical protein|uniref:DUF2304 domain-containing protein n=1 Tax=Cellvibrio fibrivorans TaxID=126350 RepID=A0ABU1V0Y9_9GAMM|nr:DUF2304 domain-containing protein [Cellvibrio fibrivorans]MDR7091075.1 hypothetical protein [Cellvibrio fibrivorans]